MAQVSKYPIRKDLYDEIFGIFLQTIVNLHSKNEVLEFFDEFLTPTERVMFAKRLAIGLLIAKNYSYKDVSELVRVSTATVSVYAQSYKNGNKYKHIIDGILLDKRIEKFLLGLAQIISTLGSIGRTKSSGWYYLKNKIRKNINKRNL